MNAETLNEIKNKTREIIKALDAEISVEDLDDREIDEQFMTAIKALNKAKAAINRLANKAGKEA